jgi:biopolymer transport protein ExbB/TolQ
MVSIPGSDLLSGALHVVSQSLLIPVMVTLLIFLVYAVIEVGGILSEYSSRIKLDAAQVELIVKGITVATTSSDICRVVENTELPREHKDVLIKIANNIEMAPKARETLARKLIEDEELKAEKRVEKTDIIGKVGPAIGLMGTLIPLGPGLSAMGSGDITTLSKHLIIAFDAAVIGMATASIGYTISKIRRRWYDDQLSTLDALAESILEVLEDVKAETKTVVFQ